MPFRVTRSFFARYAWSVLAYNLLVILWGTVVRASGSGNGCGDHWPLCEGQVIPHAAQLSTLIEFAHRMTSAVAAVLVIGLVVLAWRALAAGSAARRYAAAALVFTLLEGLIGAALVLFGETGTNASMGRVVILSCHLVNTFLLLASLALAAWTADERRTAVAAVASEAAAPRGAGTGLALAYAGGLLATLAVAIAGTIAALSDTLFHATSLDAGLQLDFAAASSPIVRLRVIHPVLAVVVAALLAGLAVRTRARVTAPAARRLAGGLLGLLGVQIGLGAFDVLLLAPLWLQVLHLLVADLVWLDLVLLAREVVYPLRSSFRIASSAAITSSRLARDF
jgi:cytochrome c oxidase assembly protein subunit 15